MRLFGAKGRPRENPDTMPGWAAGWLIHGEPPQTETPEFTAYFKARYLEREGRLRRWWREHRDELLAEAKKAHVVARGTLYDGTPDDAA